MPSQLFPTTVVGSMPRPQHIKDLVNQQVVQKTSVSEFQQVIDQAIPYIVQIQEIAGIDIVSDGEWGRKSYIGIIADICSGFDLTTREVNGEQQTWHTVQNVLKVINPAQAANEAKRLKQHTNNDIKIALPSPYLLGERMWDKEVSINAYPSKKNFTESLIPIIRAELLSLRDEGVTIAQFDDPQLCLLTDPDISKTFDDIGNEIDYSIDILNRIVDGIEGMKFALHLCRRNKGRGGWVGQGDYESIIPALNNLNFNMLMLEFAIQPAGDKRILSSLSDKFDIGLGCVDCRSSHIDTPEEIVERVEEALNFVTADRLYLHPDCGFAPGSAAEIPIDEAYMKLRNLSLAAKILRKKYG